MTNPNGSVVLRAARSSGGAVGVFLAVAASLLAAIRTSSDEVSVLSPATTLDGAPATLQIPTRSGRSHATVAATAGCSGEYHRILPVAAKTQGVGTSLWRFDLGLYAEEPASVDIAALAKNQANTNPPVVNVQVPAGEEVIIENLLGTLFNIANAGIGLRYCSGFPLAEGYFNNQGGAPGVVYGATVPALDERQATRPFRPAYFHNLTYTPSAVLGRRINIGATSNSDHNVSMVIDLYDGATKLGAINHTLLPFEHRQFTNVHLMVGAPAVASGHAVVRLLTDDSEVYTYALQVQNKSGDLVYQAATLAPPPVAPIADIFEGTWTGTWNNLTFASSGPATWTIDINDSFTLGPPITLEALRARLDASSPLARLGAGAGIRDAMLGNPGPSLDWFAKVNLSYGNNVFGSGPLTDQLITYKYSGGLLSMGDGPKVGHYDFTFTETGKIYGTLTRLPNTAIRSYKTWGSMTDKEVNLDARIDLGSTVAIATNTLYADVSPTPTPNP